MPILKTDILGSSLEINYDENELEKLNKLIKNFKTKINKYPNKDRIGKFSLIFLLAIKLEDQIYELEKLLQISKENTNNDRKLIENNNLEINDINEALFSQNLYQSNLSDPDLLIRTSGESRISDFMLWQIAYSEILFVRKYWPDFNENDFLKAIDEYKSRERRYGKISEQVLKS